MMFASPVRVAVISGVLYGLGRPRNVNPKSSSLAPLGVSMNISGFNVSMNDPLAVRGD